MTFQIPGFLYPFLQTGFLVVFGILFFFIAKKLIDGTTTKFKRILVNSIAGLLTIVCFVLFERLYDHYYLYEDLTIFSGKDEEIEISNYNNVLISTDSNLLITSTERTEEKMRWKGKLQNGKAIYLKGTLTMNEADIVTIRELQTEWQKQNPDDFDSHRFYPFYGFFWDVYEDIEEVFLSTVSVLEEDDITISKLSQILTEIKDSKTPESEKELINMSVTDYYIQK
ncbi:hypothetical protein [Alteribacter keqinensis]|uniref:Uncharacterized protein n=1 Tax=Alteribacter keqinensis TaxID=2483800 RepID=A0A3M7TZD3_9BACI|nr:hypothetical protein [Alteribacter keqinensis]RNA70124.1 hypothetical protein EBO34_09405 [Alteribacter keqinensis]